MAILGSTGRVGRAIGLGGGAEVQPLSPVLREMLQRLEFPGTVMRREIRPMLDDPANFPARYVRDPIPRGGWGPDGKFGPGYKNYATTPTITKRGTMRFYWRRPYAPRIAWPAFLQMCDIIRDYVTARDIRVPGESFLGTPP